jgi:hypothetical protein
MPASPTLRCRARCADGGDSGRLDQPGIAAELSTMVGKSVPVASMNNEDLSVFRNFRKLSCGHSAPVPENDCPDPWAGSCADVLERHFNFSRVESWSGRNSWTPTLTHLLEAPADRRRFKAEFLRRALTLATPSAEESNL